MSLNQGVTLLSFGIMCKIEFEIDHELYDNGKHPYETCTHQRSHLMVCAKLSTIFISIFSILIILILYHIYILKLNFCYVIFCNYNF